MAFEVIERDVIAGIRQGRKFGPGFLLFGAAVAAGGHFAFADRTDDLGIAVGIVGGLLGLAGLAISINAFRGAHANATLRLLRSRSHEVLWVVPTRILQNGQHRSTELVLHLKDGSTHKILQPKLRAEAWLQSLSEGIPGLLIGAEQAEAYRQRRAG